MIEQQELEKLRDRLLRERELLKKQLGNIETGVGESQSAMTGDRDYDEDYPDLGTDTFEREKDLSIELNVRALLDQIELALERMDAGDYGVCMNCGRDIGDERLEALPFTMLCISCKEEEERHR